MSEADAEGGGAAGGEGGDGYATDEDDQISIVNLMRKLNVRRGGGGGGGGGAKGGSKRSASGGNGAASASAAAAPRKKAKKEKGGEEKKTEGGEEGGGVGGAGGGGGSESQAFYEDTMKGQLVQRLLRRWWYAMDWPDVSDLPPCPAGYEELDGFPGVYIGTAEEVLGSVMDVRNHDTCPCFRNLVKKSSAELQQLLVRAYENQIAQLREHEGPDTKLERSLTREMTDARQIDTERADRQARKKFGL